MAQSDGRRSNGFNTLLIVLVGQMGCLTLVVIALSVLAGLWLDNTFHTKPFSRWSCCLREFRFR